MDSMDNNTLSLILFNSGFTQFVTEEFTLISSSGQKKTPLTRIENVLKSSYDANFHGDTFICES